jgi:hypothetical protein
MATPPNAADSTASECMLSIGQKSDDLTFPLANLSIHSCGLAVAALSENFTRSREYLQL